MAHRAYRTDDDSAVVRVGQRLYIVTIAHRYEGDAWACATEEGALKSVADYCRQWWGDVHGAWPTTEDEDGDEVTVEAPENDKECIEQYFAAMGDSEDYEVRDSILNP